MISKVSIIIIFFASSFVFCDDREEWSPETAKKLAFLPGVGQIYNQEYLKGFALIASELYSFSQAAKFSKTLDVVSRNFYIWWAIGIYVYSALDAYVEAELKSFPDKNDILDEKKDN